MEYRLLDMEHYKRRHHFEYFCSLAYPYVGVTVNVEIATLLQAIKAKKLPFFLTVCYAVSRAANRVAEFRQRIVENRIVEYAYCRTSHTVALEDGTYCYCDLCSDCGFESYLEEAIRRQALAKEKNSIEEDKNEALDKIFISTLPWISYTALVNPTPLPADSHPRITWGKYDVQGEQVLLPVSVLCHHALVDGLHIAQFYEYLNEEIARLAEEIGRLA